MKCENMKEIDRFKHTKIIVDEAGLHLIRDDGIDMPEAPTPEKVQDAREKIASAYCVLMDTGPEKFYSLDNIKGIMEYAFNCVKLAFEALETER